MAEIIDIRGRGHEPYTDFEYELMLQSFVQNHDENRGLVPKIPVSPDGKYQVSLNINGVEVNFRAVAEVVYNRYQDFMKTRAKRLVQETLEDRIQKVDERCQEITESLENFRDKLNEDLSKYITDFFPEQKDV